MTGVFAHECRNGTAEAAENNKETQRAMSLQGLLRNSYGFVLTVFITGASEGEPCAVMKKL